MQHAPVGIKTSLDSRSPAAILAAALAGALFTGLAAQVRVPLGFTPVPVTLQVFAVLAAALVLGPRTGAASSVLYLSLATAGVPLWAGGQGGAAYFLTSSGPIAAPTLGYLLAFPFASFGTGWLWQRTASSNPGHAFVCGLAGVAIIHAGGLAWISAQYIAALGPVTGLRLSLAQGVLPFVLLDVAKAMAAGALVAPVSRCLRATHIAG